MPYIPGQRDADEEEGRGGDWGIPGGGESGSYLCIERRQGWGRGEGEAIWVYPRPVGEGRAAAGSE